MVRKSIEIRSLNYPNSTALKNTNFLYSPEKKNTFEGNVTRKKYIKEDSQPKESESTQKYSTIWLEKSKTSEENYLQKKKPK